MNALIVTGSGLRKVNELMLVPSASIVPSGCAPCACNISYMSDDLCLILLYQLQREVVVRSYSKYYYTQPGVCVCVCVCVSQEKFWL